MKDNLSPGFSTWSYAIDCPYNRISDRPSSHRAGWARIRRSQMNSLYTNSPVKVIFKDEPWDSFDQVYLYMGMEWSNILQFPGGMQESDFIRLQRLITYKEKLTLLETSNIDGLAKSLFKRKDLDKYAVNPPEFRNAIESVCTHLISKTCGGHTFGEQFDKDFQKKVVVLGDSHAASLYTKGAVVLRNDFQTLHGALKKGLLSYVQGATGTPEKFVFYFGNIDIRHHICRLSSETEGRHKLIDELVNEYSRQIKDVCSFYNIKSFTVVAPLWIESEDRVLPKSGFYDGKPFHGSFQERRDVRDYMVDKLIETFGLEQVFTWPPFMLKDDGDTVLDQEYMEKPRSVHLAPSAYPFNVLTDNPNPLWTENSWGTASYNKLIKE